jgi:hypothetical protein
MMNRPAGRGVERARRYSIQGDCCSESGIQVHARSNKVEMLHLRPIILAPTSQVHEKDGDKEAENDRGATDEGQ